MRQLRLLAALAVVIGHGFVLTDLMPPPRIGGIPLHNLGLYIFFTVSGYVITRSWDRSPHLATFLRNRALRILPALIVTILLTVAVIGPLATSLPLADYLVDPRTWQYLSGVLLVPQYQLPGVFLNHPSSAVNGSLWTLGIEACCYLLTAIIGLTLRRFAILGTLFLGAIAITVALQPTGTPFESLRAVGAVSSYFAIGALMSHLRLDRYRLPLVPNTGIVLAWAGVGVIVPSIANILAWAILPAVVLTVVTRSEGPDSRPDLSYGVYLWGYPIQQLVLQANPDLPIFFSIGVTVAVVLATAALSWRHVEAPSLGLKLSTRTRTRSLHRTSATALLFHTPSPISRES